MKKICQILLCYLFIFSALCCNDDDNDDTIIPMENSSFIIPPGKTFEWRLDELLDTYTTDADVIDIDAFSATPELVANLKAQGKTVIAYISVGSVENFRDDAIAFPESVIGNIYDGFEDENWLDIREIELLAPIMEARLNMIKAKGFDGVEPDNINGYQNNTGFNLTEADCAAYSRYLIEQAHNRQLSIGQKNAEELVADMKDEFDWFLAEDAFVDDFFNDLTPYITLGKAVFMVEYNDEISEADFLSQACPAAADLNFSAVLKNRDLTDFTRYCN